MTTEPELLGDLWQTGGVGNEILDTGRPNASLVKAVDRPARSRVVPVAGLAASIVAFVVCMGVVIEHLLTPDFVQVAAFLVVSIIPVLTGLASRSYYRRLSAGSKRDLLTDKTS